MAAEWNKSRAEAECKFRTQRRKEIEAEEDEYDGHWNIYGKKEYKYQNETQSRTRRHESGATFSVRSVSDGGSEYGNRFVRINGLKETNPIYKLEGVLRICYQETQSYSDEFGVIQRYPEAKANPLLCNLKDPESTRNTK